MLDALNHFWELGLKIKIIDCFYEMRGGCKIPSECSEDECV